MRRNDCPRWIGICKLIRLGDGHPFNIYRMIEEIAERGLAPFLANPNDFIDWKHRQSSEYIKGIEFNPRETAILGLLKQLPNLDFDSIARALTINANDVSDDLLRLTNLHVIESSADTFTVSPPLQIAVERDSRLRLQPAEQTAAIKSLAQSLSLRLEEGTAPITLVDAAVLSSLESGDSLTNLAAAFLLPSHHVWLAKRCYDRKNWRDAIRYASEALKGADRLSGDGLVAACRFSA